jgi:hypothetical protein
MPRRCPPGVFCIENVTIIFICVIFAILGLVLYIVYMRSVNKTKLVHDKNSVNNFIISSSPKDNSKGYGNDVFYDIYKAPLRDDNCFIGANNMGANNMGANNMGPNTSDIRINPFNNPGVIPINVSTQGCDDAKYRQVGILTRINGKEETILPLMGRPLFTRRDKWNFYTLNDKNNMIKLPITVKGRSGTDEYGCDNLYNGDTVFVEGYNNAFKVTTYDNQVMRYLPSL